MANQPYYHCVDGILFTATEFICAQDIIDALKSIKGIVPESVEIEPGGFYEPEPGDPADL